ncbi:hypothetical protein BaRGS_00001290 [Batillaria attramentaria]|uniref:Uncharacterized protein n=1 Tax=Batillaria attramentaria TaxID=370345 RepID=A0ABD0M6K9_9CAEN
MSTEVSIRVCLTAFSQAHVFKHTDSKTRLFTLSATDWRRKAERQRKTQVRKLHRADNNVTNDTDGHCFQWRQHLRLYHRRHHHPRHQHFDNNHNIGAIIAMDDQGHFGLHVADCSQCSGGCRQLYGSVHVIQGNSESSSFP